MATKTKPKPATNGKPKAAPLEPDILTLEEAAEFLRVPVSALQVEVANGRVPGRVISGVWRFSKSALVAWLNVPTPQEVSGRDRLLALAGLWKDDPSVDELMRGIEKRRKANRLS